MQDPQCALLALKSKQEPEQQAGFVPLQGAAVHEPQWFKSVLTLVHDPEQQFGTVVLHLIKLSAHLTSTYVRPVSEPLTAELHAPQFDELLERSVHDPVQQAGCTPPQALLQLPQFWALVLRFVQVPVQHAG